MTRNLPNWITFSRLVLAVVFFVLVSFEGTAVLTAALAVFVVACLSDLLDGYLARRCGQETSLGRIADPFVDKVIVCGGFTLLCPPERQTVIAPWMVVLLISREFLVSSFRGYAESRGVAFGARWAGKVKTAVQMIALALVIYFKAYGNLPFLPSGLSGWITAGAVYLALVLTVFSLGTYAAGIGKVMNAPDDARPH
jgi:CDP-diacylglycerol--glycerol-3-phosphate 3-phosphatidyltransferase